MDVSPQTRREFSLRYLYNDGSEKFIFCPRGNDALTVSIHGGIILENIQDQDAVQRRWARVTWWTRVSVLTWVVVTAICLRFAPIATFLVALMYPRRAAMRKIFWTDWAIAYTSHLTAIFPTSSRRPE